MSAGHRYLTVLLMVFKAAPAKVVKWWILLSQVKTIVSIKQWLKQNALLLLMMQRYLPKRNVKILISIPWHPSNIGIYLITE
jgi:hypothetical protein